MSACSLETCDADLPGDPSAINLWRLQTASPIVCNSYGHRRGMGESAS